MTPTVPGCYKSHSCEAQWVLSCSVASEQVQVEQTEVWLHMAGEAGQDKRK